MKTINGILMMVLMALIAVPAGAQQRAGRMDRADRNRPQMMMQWLGLSDQQQEQVKQLHLDLSQQLLPLQNQLREKRAELRTLTTGDDADLTAAEAVVRQMADLRAQVMIQRLRTHQQIRALLTDEQKVKFDARPHFGRIKSMQAPMPGRRGRM